MDTIFLGARFVIYGALFLFSIVSFIQAIVLSVELFSDIRLYKTLYRNPSWPYLIKRYIKYILLDVPGILLFFYFIGLGVYWLQGHGK